jgi:hypothetical protein
MYLYHCTETLCIHSSSTAGAQGLLAQPAHLYMEYQQHQQYPSVTAGAAEQRKLRTQEHEHGLFRYVYCEFIPGV